MHETEFCMKTVFYPRGTCSTRFDIDLADGIINDVVITGGCNGNLQGISRLIKGRPAREIIPMLKGIRCGWKETSCPDQIAKALEQALEKEDKQK